MIGLVMAGGKGTRMNNTNGTEKLLLKYKKPVILHVLESLKKANCFSKILAITSPHSPKTRELLCHNDVEIFDAPGYSYVHDLNLALCNMSDVVLVTSGDLPLLDYIIVKQVAALYDSNYIWTSIVVTAEFLAKLGVHNECTTIVDNHKCHYTGVSLINTDKITSFTELNINHLIINDKRLAFNINTQNDYNLLDTF